MVNQGDETIDAFQHFTATPIIPPKQSFGEFLYNPKKKTVMGRTADSWSKYKFSSFYIAYLTKIGTPAHREAIFFPTVLLENIFHSYSQDNIYFSL